MNPSEIKALRKRLGLNTKKFGELFPISASAVEHWEQGIRNPSKVSLRILEDLNQKGGNKQ